MRHNYPELTLFPVALRFSPAWRFGAGQELFQSDARLGYTLLSCTPSTGLPASPLAATLHTGKVVGIADGDTLTLLVDRRQVKVRLAEIDAPEQGQLYGTKAREALSALAFGNSAAVLEVDRDRYGRIVGQVYVGGVDVNAKLVRQGYAWVYRKYAKRPRLYELEREAREARRGLWADGNPVPPWEWRRR